MRERSNPVKRSNVDNRRLQVLVLAFSIVLLDQFSKIIFSKFFETSCNLRAAFGVDLNFLPKGVMFGILFVILSFILYLLMRSRQKYQIYALGLIFGGGVSNFVDRLTIGCMRDFITIPLWPTTFNLADLAITFGVLTLIFPSFKKSVKKE